MKKAYILSATRTPIGSYGGIFKNIDATELGATAIRGALENADISPDMVEEVYMGNVISANLGQAPARQAALKAGLPHSIPCTTINKVCSSGMKAIMLAAQNIVLGYQDVIVAGGMENMSRIPYYVPQARFGYKFGEGALIDGLQKDGLADAYSHEAMGVSADRTAEKHGFSREAQDEYAIQSYQRSSNSTKSGLFKNEITPVKVPQRKGDPVKVSEDEEYKKVNFEKIPQLRPAFTRGGTVTAANASTINDGASALLIVSENFLKDHGLTPLAEITSWADAAHEPEWFTTAPPLATSKVLARGGLKVTDIDLFEVNEAFSIVPMVFAKELDIAPDKMNILGGAVSLGHPLGASGARIVTTLLNALDSRDKSVGCASICNGGGGASSMIIRKVN
ncbi:thiolase family protein [Membranicola marinus]|uniref:Thiolase family protein n=1 Tax=Membranihabitans marinus TaxID=1227546 RepID=A0A953HTU4_9BACT|nr:thiolase family protein [Membranihabitans marinus]MBY5957768.1 thiolase family protein [Membranihabitans marinus]